MGWKSWLCKKGGKFLAFGAIFLLFVSIATPLALMQYIKNQVQIGEWGAEEPYVAPEKGSHEEML